MAFEENPTAGKTAPGSAGVVTFSREPEASGGFFNAEHAENAEKDADWGKERNGGRRATEGLSNWGGSKDGTGERHV